MKRLLFTIVCIITWCAGKAQTPVIYEAKVYTPTGVKKGVLERVYNQGIGILLNDDVTYIDALDIKHIHIKRYGGSFGSKVLGTALIGSIAALNMSTQADQDKIDHPANYNYDYKTSTLSDNAGYALVGAALGSMVGMIPPMRKNKKFTINQDSSQYHNILADMAQYGRYNQLVPASVNVN